MTMKLLLTTTTTTTMTTSILWMMMMISMSQNEIAHGYYLPGVTPYSFGDGENVELKVNKIASSKTLMPIDYYRVPFCRPKDGIQKKHENLGELMSGERIENSPYILRMKDDMYCEQLCLRDVGRGRSKNREPSFLYKVIKNGYHHNWIIDNLPAASIMENDNEITTKYWSGFPIGKLDEYGNAYIYNHVNIIISYHEVDDEINHYRVVKFLVEPFSIAHEFDPSDPFKIYKPIASCDPDRSRVHTSYEMVHGIGDEYKNSNIPGPQVAQGNVLFTYDVIWKEDKELHWASRWDIYLTNGGVIPAKVHWMSITNSVMIVLVLSAMLGAILIRNLNRDIARYNKLSTTNNDYDVESREDALEEYGWKLVHADLFRAPKYPMILSIGMGTGTQLLLMSLLTIFFSALGFMSPARRGHLLMVQLFLYVLLGAVNGYVTARFYKTFDGKRWNYATFVTAFGFPGIAFCVFLLMNVVALFKKSTDAVPFLTLFLLVLMWFCISTPLVYMGAYFGYKQDVITFPVKTSGIPRTIPEQPVYMTLPMIMFIAGILPFGSCFVEMYYIMSSVWMDYYYYVFGFLLIVFIILMLTCAEIAILLNYFALCQEDYHWWYRSFYTGGSVSLYVFMYSFFYFQQLHANVLSTYVLYFGYMSLACFALFCMTGTVGLYSCLLFNQVIFASIKID